MKSSIIIKEKSLVLQKVCEEFKSLLSTYPQLVRSNFCDFDKTLLVVIHKEENIFPSEILKQYESQKSLQLDLRSDKTISDATLTTRVPKSLKSTFKIPKIPKIETEQCTSNPKISSAFVCDEEDTFEEIDAAFEREIQLDNNVEGVDDKSEKKNNEYLDQQQDSDSSDSKSDCSKNEEELKSKSSVLEYQQMINVDEVLDFEEYDDDDEEDDGNFKRKKKPEKTEISTERGGKIEQITEKRETENEKKAVLSSTQNSRVTINPPTSRYAQDAKPSNSTMNVDIRGTALVSSRVENKNRGNREMPLDDIMKRMQTPNDRLRTRERAVAIDDIMSSLRSEGPEEAMRLFSNKIPYLGSMQEPCFQEVLEKIALSAIKSSKFNKIFNLRRRLEEAKITNSEFWNKFIPDAFTRLRNMKDEYVRTILQDIYYYLLRNDVNITIKNAQHLLDLVSRRVEKPDFKPSNEPVNRNTNTSTSNAPSKIIKLTSISNVRSNIPLHLNSNITIPPSQMSSQTATPVVHQQLPQPSQLPYVSNVFDAHQIPNIQRSPHFQNICEPPFRNISVPFQSSNEPVTPTNIPAHVLSKLPFNFQNIGDCAILLNEDMELSSPTGECESSNIKVVNAAPNKDSDVKTEISATESVSQIAKTNEPQIPFKCINATKFLSISKPCYSSPTDLKEIVLNEDELKVPKIEWQCPDVDIPDPRKMNKQSENEKCESTSETRPEENKATCVEISEGKQTVILQTSEIKKRFSSKPKKKLKICRTFGSDVDHDITNVTIRVGEIIPPIQIIKNYNSQNSGRIVRPVKRKIGEAGNCKVVKRKAIAPSCTK